MNNILFLANVTYTIAASDSVPANGFARPTPTDHPSSLADMLKRHCYFPDFHRQRRIRHGWRISACVRALLVVSINRRYQNRSTVEHRERQ